MEITQGKTVRDIALEMPQTTRIFEEFKIDYCCGGRRSIDDACEKAGVDPKALLEKLEGLFSSADQQKDWIGSQPLGAIVEYIVAKHHVYTKDELNNLSPLMDKVARVHGYNHPELMRLKAAFEELADELGPHMMKEENVLFPYIEDLEARYLKGYALQMPPFGTVAHPVRMMMIEHDTAGDILRRMRELSSDYTTPPDACPSLTGLFHRLQELERDLHEHIHLENNVLFPRAVQMEEAAVEAVRH